jgi:hypothetical protein
MKLAGATDEQLRGDAGPANMRVMLDVLGCSHLGADALRNLYASRFIEQLLKARRGRRPAFDIELVLTTVKRPVLRPDQLLRYEAVRCGA